MGTDRNRKRSARWTLQEAERELGTWEASGLSKAAFARERGYSERRLSSWASRLAARRALTPGESTALVPVRVVDSRPPRAAAWRSECGFPIEVELRNGMMVRIVPGLDGGELERVLGVVGRC